MLAQTTFMAAGLLSLLVSPTLASFHDLDATLHNRMLMNKRQNGKTFNLMSDWRNASFFDNWDFFNYDDPTHGKVNYVDRETASAGPNPLAFINRRGNPVIRVDYTNDLPWGQNRNSVRITSKQRFQKGQLLILDAIHMPTGCATWPAFWTATENWPAGGEIDIVEGVNTATTNQYTLHTTEGCKTTLPMQAKATVVESDCNVYATPYNLGCGNKESNTKSFGPGFNKAGGGVYATLWDDDGIKIWWFPRDRIPRDVTMGSPKPSTWGYPRSYWAQSGCDTDKYFDPQIIIINTTLCGDWAGADNVYPVMGCPGSCQSQVMGASNFRKAYWEIGYVRIFN